MLKRIPHSTQDISGELNTDQYVKHHRKVARAQFKPFLRLVEQQCVSRRLPPDGRFLEIGSGPGFLTAIMADQYPQAEMNALEISADMISRAKTVVNQTQPACRVRFIEGSADDRSLLARLGKFDLVYSTFSLHHWEEPVRAIKSMYRTLKEGGLMLLYDLKRVSWLYLLPASNGFINSIRAAYRPKEIRNMLSQAELSDFEMKTLFPYFWHAILIAK